MYFWGRLLSELSNAQREQFRECNNELIFNCSLRRFWPSCFSFKITEELKHAEEKHTSTKMCQNARIYDATSPKHTHTQNIPGWWVCWGRGPDVRRFAESLFTIRCVFLWGSPWLEAGSEWQVEKKEQTAERHHGTMYVLVIQLDDWCSDRMCVPVTASVQSTQWQEE